MIKPRTEPPAHQETSCCRPTSPQTSVCNGVSGCIKLQHTLIPKCPVDQLQSDIWSKTQNWTLMKLRQTVIAFSCFFPSNNSNIWQQNVFTLQTELLFINTAFDQFWASVPTLVPATANEGTNINYQVAGGFFVLCRHSNSCLLKSLRDILTL